MGKDNSSSSSSPKPKKSSSSKSNKKSIPPFNLVVQDDNKSGGGDSANNNNSAAGTTTTTTTTPTFDDAFDGVVQLLDGRKNLIVLVGAGISTSCGIPDFRSRDSGLYQSLDTNALGLSCAEELFCYDFFQDNPVPFYKFAQNLYFPLGRDRRVEPSDSHKLLAMLEEKKMLLRVYT